MAVRKTSGRKRTGQSGGGKSGGSRKVPGAVLFWLAFFIIITGLFWVNREIIRKNYDSMAARITGRSAEPQSPGAPPLPEDPPSSVATPPPASVPAPAGSGSEVSRRPDPEAPRPRETPPPAVPAEPPAPARRAPPEERPAAQPANRGPGPEKQAPRETQSPREPVRERAVYFTQVDREGAILRSKTSRKLPPSDSPMLDALNALLQGPNTEEQRRGMVSLIPQGTRILSATVRGSTAYISFSEEFQYNTYGVEGYAAQLKQIVWTATEFPNVRDVQILIEGRRVDYLGEGIWIGSPLNRDEI